MTIKDFLFKAKDGTYVYGEKPNWPLYLVLGFQILRQVAPNEDIETVLSSAVPATLLYWAYLEVAYGTTNFKRALGGVIGFIALANLIHSITA